MNAPRQTPDDHIAGGLPRPQRPTPPKRSVLSGLWAAVREVGIVLVMALVLSFVVKTWFFQAFFIPSGSMEETLLIGDRVIVSKMTPGLFDLQRGDVVVFEDPSDWLAGSQVAPPPSTSRLHDALTFIGVLPNDAQNHLIKRVIGLPGDHVACCGADGRVTVNGEPLTEPYIYPGDEPSLKSFDIVVPEGHVWVMGDHRSDSEDSRYRDDGTGETGSVPVARITGRSVLLVWPFDRFGWLSNHSPTFGSVPAP